MCMFIINYVDCYNISCERADLFTPRKARLRLITRAPTAALPASEEMVRPAAARSPARGGRRRWPAVLTEIDDLEVVDAVLLIRVRVRVRVRV